MLQINYFQIENLYIDFLNRKFYKTFSIYIYI